MNKHTIKHAFLTLLLLIFTSLVFAETEHLKYFANSDYELNVYHIKGEKPGKTLMIIGGIQGDESGGYLTADSYVDINIEKGSMIIVPRANVPTIVQNKRQINKDMNRRFNQPKTEIFEDQVVDILKQLMDKSDILLNLHEGGGYYRDTYIDATRNPMKFGQCIIADADSFYSEKHGKTIYLGDVARTVCKEVNQSIYNDYYHFHFNNHNTISSSTNHAEQRNSATYHGLTNVGIPSFGIEVSKQLPNIEMKINHLSLVINAFLKHLEIIPQIPHINHQKPDFEYLIVKVDGHSQIVEKSSVLVINKPADIEITALKGNYNRGYLLDIEAYGTTNDINKSFFIDKDTQIIIRKDYDIIDKIPIIIQSEEEAYNGIVLSINNKKQTLKPGQGIKIDKNDTVKIIELLNADNTYEANFLGYANAKLTANDIGLDIIVDDKLIKKFSPDGGKSWLIDILKNKKRVSTHRLFVNEPDIIVEKQEPKQFQLEYVLNGKTNILNEGDTLYCKNGDRLLLVKPILSSKAEAIIKQKDIPYIKINLAGFVSDPKKDGDDKGLTFTINDKKFYPKFALSKNLYELQVNLYEKRYALFYLKITE